jgi:hypothetical protein
MDSGVGEMNTNPQYRDPHAAATVLISGSEDTSNTSTATA